MSELWLKFSDTDGRGKRIHVEGPRFTVGRHSGNQLCIPDGRLSREHLSIERFGDIFVVSDCGSSNGSTVNGKKLDAPVALQAGDMLELGGLVIETEFEGAGPLPENPSEPTVGSEMDTPPTVVSSPPVVKEGSSFPIAVFFLAPVLGLLIIGVVVGAIYFVGGSEKEIADDEFQYSTDNPDDSEDAVTAKKSTAPTPLSSRLPDAVNNAVPTGTNTIAPNAGPSTRNDSESARVEQYGASFLRRIAQNDPTAFLTRDQAQKVAVRIKQLTNNSVLAANIGSAKQNSAQITSLAAANNLKPQFLAVAAITKLGSSRGDVARTAQSMTETLDKLRTHLGNELSDDTLLMIAAYDQGEAGDVMKMRNMLQDLANKFPDSSRAIRTVWFLQQNGKITQAEFDRAVTFLAIGTITQNPKDFGVNAEALVL